MRSASVSGSTRHFTCPARGGGNAGVCGCIAGRMARPGSVLSRVPYPSRELAWLAERS
jgi:hypothetical protein